MIRDVIGVDFTYEFRARLPQPPRDLLGGESVRVIEQSRLVRIKHDRTVPTNDQLEPLYDPLLEVIAGHSLDHGAHLDVFCQSGVTDEEGDMATKALAYTGLTNAECRTGTRYRFASTVPSEFRDAVVRHLGNPLIHAFHWSDEPAVGETGTERRSVPEVRHIALTRASDDQLNDLSRAEHLALDLDEMRAVAAHFRAQSREPTDVELQSIALAWSEHCSHKTFKAEINFEGPDGRETVDGLLKDCIAQPTRALNKPWVRSAFVDNAGIIAFDADHDIAVKVETHNHPSALEPYGGAHTGVGGVIRDVLAVSAQPIANTNVLCFGNLNLPDDHVPPGSHHPRRTFREVVRGIGDYGNNMGIPTVGGGIFFGSGFTANPLVFAGTVGYLPHGGHATNPQTGDAIVLIGGQTGRDGLHGATMSSESLDRETVAGTAVQIGAPVTEKVVRDVLEYLRNERLYNAITDCGAGGLCSAVGEMGEDLGVELELNKVPLKYEGLAPWEVWLSEAQERMVLSIPPSNLARVGELCRDHEVDVTVLGYFTSDRRLRLSYDGLPVANLNLEFMHGGRPRRTLNATWQQIQSQPATETGVPIRETILALLSHPNIASREEIIRRYDHEVQGGVVIKPLTERTGHSDGAVVCPGDGSRGVAIAHGFNPMYGDDPYAMAMLAIDEALRNLVAIGGSIDEAALLDNFCWGDVDTPDALGGLVRAAQGCRDGAELFETPFICGKDSLRNTSTDATGVHSIPGSLLITAVGVIDDSRCCVTSALSGSDEPTALYLVGETNDECGGAHLQLVTGMRGGEIPKVRHSTPSDMRRLTAAIQSGLVLSCHDLSEGGLAVAATEMGIAGNRGLTIDCSSILGSANQPATMLFSESPGRFLVEVAIEHANEFEQLWSGTESLNRIGSVDDSSALTVTNGDRVVATLSIAELESAWRTPLSPDLGGIARPVTEKIDITVAEMPIKASRQHTSVARPSAVILMAPGTNCDIETVNACRTAGAKPERVWLNELVTGRRQLKEFDVFIIPGGFAHGDHLGAGSVVSTIIKHELMGDLQRFIDSGRPVIGICNGFQVLCKLGLLGPVTLAKNSHGLFECRWVPLRVAASPCPFFEGVTDTEWPIAHGEGCVVIDGDDREIMTRSPLRYLQNPNGSARNIAGICSPEGNVLGFMPHPERFISADHHPGRRADRVTGLQFYENVMNYARGVR